jgi:hypothetical protein
MLLVEVIDMKKSTITRTWIGGLVVVALGLIMAGVGVGLMLAYGGTFTHAAKGSAYNFVPSYDSFFWSMVAVIALGSFAAAIGGLVQLVAWIGGLVNTYRLPDKTWFAVLLIGGVLGLTVSLIGFAAMVVYLVAGPDGMALPKAESPVQGARPGSLAPTR